VAGPSIAALLCGVAERFNLLPFHGDEYYWALTRVKTNHCVFLFNTTYVLALQYFAEVTALLILAWSGRHRGGPLTMLNLLAGLGGLGIGLMYAVAVETHFSVVANMCLPLRFECVMYPLILANVVRSAFCLTASQASAGLLAALYGTLLVFPQFKPLLWAWAWALGHDHLLGGVARSRRHLIWLIVGAVIVLGYLALGPSGQPLRWNVMHSLPFLVGAAVLVCAILVAWWIGRVWPRLTFAAACLGCVMIAPRIWMTNPAWLIEEVRSVVNRRVEESPERQTCEWLNNHVAPGTPVLAHNALFLHRMTQVRTAVNKDLVEYFVYAPRFARPLAEELKDLYGLDVLAMAVRGERLYLTQEDWLRARSRVLAYGRCGDRSFGFVIEPAHVPPAQAGNVVFSNQYARIYGVSQFLTRVMKQ
jgi:hypothetical protein